MLVDSLPVLRTNDHEGTPSQIAEALHTLVLLAHSQRPFAVSETLSGKSSEEVILDTEVGGCRYLLIRMVYPISGPIRLSPREQEIVRMVAKGHPNKVIADVLSISTWTVCTHIRRIFAKLGVGSRAAMVAKMLETGNFGGDMQNLSNHFR